MAPTNWGKKIKKTPIKEILKIILISLIGVSIKLDIYFTKFTAFSKTAVIPVTFFFFLYAKNGCPPPFPSMYFPNSRITVPAFKPLFATNSLEI